MSTTTQSGRSYELIQRQSNPEPPRRYSHSELHALHAVLKRARLLVHKSTHTTLMKNVLSVLEARADLFRELGGNLVVRRASRE